MAIPQLRPKSNFKKTWRENKVASPRLRSRHAGGRFSRFQLTKENLRRTYLPLAVLATFIFVLLGVAVFAWLSKDLPNPDQVIDRSIAQSTRIYARDGETLLFEVHGDQKRTLIELADIPDYAVQSTIAIEDKNFYNHKGFSLWSIFRSAIVDLTSGKSYGGSTITQQFVKNAILSNEKSFSRKIKELVLSYELERKFTKDQILKLYFNEIPYGSTNYGIEAAAQSYFGKSAHDLTLDEAALLAAMPQAPTYYSPYGSHTDDLVGRQHYVLSLMVEQKYITQDEADAAIATDTLEKIIPRRESILAPHFTIMVREYLTEKYGEAAVEQGGLKVITTLEPNLQRYAEDAVANHVEANLKNYNASNAALVSLNPHTGQILSMVGSKDYFDESIDGNVNVTLRPRQPGSSFKPIVYATAFKRGFTPDTIIFDLVTKFKTDNGDYEPHNYTDQEYGPVTMRKALAGSLNITAVKTLYLAGVTNVLDFADGLGYTTLGDRDRFGLSLVLGGGEVKLLEHANAFATFATNGLYHPTSFILSVEDRNGKKLEEWKESERRAIDEKVAEQVNSVLSDDGARAYIFGAGGRLTLPGRPVAAKTGTTNDYRDAWTMGFTPDLVTGVWVGNNDNSEMRRGADGSIVAAPIWNEYMRQATTGAPVVNFTPPPANTATKPILRGELQAEESVKVDAITGKRIPDSCIDEWPDDMIVEKKFRDVHTILYYVDPSNPDGDAPKDPSKDPQYERWEEPVRRWAEGQGYTDTLPAFENCGLRAEKNRPSVTITSPTTNETISSSPTTFTVTVAKGAEKIASVEYSIDGRSIGKSTSAPYSKSYQFSGFANGFHTLTAKVIDTIGNSGSDSVKFNLLLTYTSATISIVDPGSNTSYSLGSDVPINVSIFAADPNGVTSVALLVDGVVVGSVSHPTDQIITITWSPTKKGSHQLTARLINNNAVTTTSTARTVTIEN